LVSNFASSEHKASLSKLISGSVGQCEIQLTQTLPRIFQQAEVGFLKNEGHGFPALTHV
jgi:hypothetical protein